MTPSMVSVLVMVLAAGQASRPAAADTAAWRVAGVPARVARDMARLGSMRSIAILAAGGGAAFAVHPADDSVNRHFEGTGASDAFFKPGQVIGNSIFILGVSGATYVLGRKEHLDRVQHLAMDEIEAQILAEGLVFGIKETVRRPRPVRQEVPTATGFSFPSGHAASTFAAATVLQQHLGYKAGIPTYLIATYVAMSRLHENVHFASDVVFGAAVGIIVGRSVTWHGRNFYASPMLVPKGSGIMVTVNLAPAAALPAR